jgi:hypothetical protein
VLTILVCFRQFIAQRILEINENGKFKKSFDTVEEYMAQDDEIFHRARLVNCGYFMNIILKGTWFLTPRLSPSLTSSNKIMLVQSLDLCKKAVIGVWTLFR